MHQKAASAELVSESTKKVNSELKNQLSDLESKLAEAEKKSNVPVTVLTEADSII